MSVEKTINGIDFYVELETDEMYRRGTVSVYAERGDDSEIWHIGPQYMQQFLYQDSSVKNFMKLDQWMEDGLDTEGWAQLDELVGRLAEREITYCIWFRDGQGSQDFLTEAEMRVQAERFNFSADDAINSRSGAVMTDEDGQNLGGCYLNKLFDNPDGELN